MAAGTAWNVVALQTILTDVASSLLSGVTAGLFLSDHTPAAGDSAGTYTAIEAAWTGYARQSCGFGSATNDGTEAYMNAVTMTFTVTAGGTGSTVYGYFLLDSGGALILAERIVTPVSVVDGVPILLDVQPGLRNP